MSKRLVDDLTAEAERCDRLAGGYRLAGDRRLAAVAGLAAQSARAAGRQLKELADAEANSGKEPA